MAWWFKDLTELVQNDSEVLEAKIAVFTVWQWQRRPPTTNETTLGAKKHTRMVDEVKTITNLIMGRQIATRHHVILSVNI